MLVMTGWNGLGTGLANYFEPNNHLYAYRSSLAQGVKSLLQFPCSNRLVGFSRGHLFPEHETPPKACLLKIPEDIPSVT